MLKQLGVVIAMIVVWPMAAHTQTIIGNQIEITLPVDQNGTQTNALVYLPDDYNSTKQDYALIFFLHGIGQAGTNIKTLITDGLPQDIAKGFLPQAINPKDGKLYKFIVVSPQSPSWSYGYSNIKYMLPAVLKKYRIDTTRLYLTGLSAGGWGSWTCVTDDSTFSNGIAAMAVMSAAPLEAFRAPYVVTAARNHLPVWDICGMSDGFYAPNLKYIREIDAKEPNPIPDSTWLYNVGHSSWHQGYDPHWKGRTGNSTGLNVYEWFLLWTRKGVVNSSSPPPPPAPPTATVPHPSTTLTLPDDSTTLSGSGSAPTGASISGYLWTVISGPPGSAIASPYASVTSFNHLSAGIYKVVFTVTDSQGLSASDTVTVTVKAAVATIPPTALITPASVTLTLPTNFINLSSQGSAAPIGATLTGYKWTMLSGPSAYGMGNPDSAVLSLWNLVAGTYRLSVTVKDNQGLSASDTVTVKVLPALLPPIARVTPTSATLTLPLDSVVLNGTTSTAPPGATLTTYVWKVLTGPSGSVLSTALGASTTLSGLIKATYTLALTVTDNQGLSASDTLTITVHQAPPPPVLVPPVARITPGSVTLTWPLNYANIYGSSSSAPSGATLTSYVWTMLTGPTGYGMGNPDSVELGLWNLSVGTYRLALTVKDNQNLSAADTVTLLVLPALVPPVAKVAPADITLTLPVDSTRLNGSASTAPSGATLTTYLWKVISGPTGSIIGSPAASMTEVSHLTAGTYTIAFTVADNQKLSASDTVTVIVLAAKPPPPPKSPVAVVSPAAVTITLPVDSTHLDGTASKAPSGASLTGYQWKVISGPVGATLSTTTGATTEVGHLTAGTYTIACTISDNQKLSASDTVTVTVLAAKAPPPPPPPPPAPTPPVAKISPPTVTVTLPIDSVRLDGSASVAPAGASLTGYQWKVISGPTDAALSTSTGSATEVGHLAAGTYTILFTVTDNQKLSASDTATVTVLAATMPPPPPTAPVAKVSPHSITLTLPVDSAKVSASASTAPSGASLTGYRWTVISGPAGSTLSAATGAVTEVGHLVAGTYTAACTVTDNQKLSASDTVTLTVLAAKPPVVTTPVPPKAIIAGGSMTLTLPVDSAVLDGSESTAPTGTSLTTYQWKWLKGSSQYTLSGESDVKARLTRLSIGSYEVSLTVTDSKGLSASDTATITVVPSRQRPVAIISNSDTVVNMPDPGYVLDGSKSFAGAGDTLVSYQWTELGGPSGVLFLSVSGGLAMLDAWSEAGSYVFQLIVVDQFNARDTATLVIRVNNPDKHVVKIYPNPVGSSLNIWLSPTVTGKVALTVYDATGRIMTHTDIQTTGQNAQTAVIDVSNLLFGVYFLRVESPGVKVSVPFMKGH